MAEIPMFMNNKKAMSINSYDSRGFFFFLRMSIFRFCCPESTLFVIVESFSFFSNERLYREEKELHEKKFCAVYVRLLQIRLDIPSE